MRRSLLLPVLAALAGSSACKTRATPGAAPQAAAPDTAGPAIAPSTSAGPLDRRAGERERIADVRTAPQAPLRVPGSSKEDPLAACGTTGSYVAVADAECDDGSRPFDGDIPQGARARRGNVGPNASGHIIDLYEVPCPEGPKRIFVDMYGCDQARPSRSEIERDYFVGEVFLAGDHARFAERCLAEEARGPGRVTLMLQACLPAMPTALREQGKAKEANDWLARHCAGTPAPSADEPKRYYYFRNVVGALAALREHQGRPEAERAAELARVTAEYARVCDVDGKAYETWLKSQPD